MQTKILYPVLLQQRDLESISRTPIYCSISIDSDDHKSITVCSSTATLLATVRADHLGRANVKTDFMLGYPITDFFHDSSSRPKRMAILPPPLLVLYYICFFIYPYCIFISNEHNIRIFQFFPSHSSRHQTTPPFIKPRVPGRSSTPSLHLCE